MGCISPIGNTVQETWESLLAGHSGVGLIEHFDTTDFAVKIAASVKGYQAEDHFERKAIKKMDTFIQYGMVAAAEAIQDAGLIVDDSNRERIGCAISSGTVSYTHLTLPTIYSV